MGYKVPRFPAADPEEMLRRPFHERVRFYGNQWAEWGFGSARNIQVMYLCKIFGAWLIGGLLLVTLTSGLNPLDPGSWWTNPIVYQKMLVMTMLLDALGVAGSWGPLAGKFGPLTGGVRFWSRVGTIKLPPFTWVPFTSGNRRQVFDVFLYWGFLFSLGAALLMPGRTADELPSLARFQAFLADPANGMPSWLADNAASFTLIQTMPLIVAVIFLLLVGLRDKVIFLAARAEQYLPPVVFFIVFPLQFEVVDMILAIKLYLVWVWVAAGFSKLNGHFGPVIPPMLSNTPFWPPRWLKKSMYQDFANDDLRTSRLGMFVAHVPGTIVEIAVPLTLLFLVASGPVPQFTVLVAALLMVGFCLFIISTFPVAVPLEWNMLFILCVTIFFIGYPNHLGFGVFDWSNPWMPLAILALPIFFVVYGSIRPDKISFLISIRPYGGNWATSNWAIHPDAEHKLHRVYRPTTDQIDQLQAMGLPFGLAEMFLEMAVGWRSLHSQGRGLHSVLRARVPDIDHRRVREGEFATNAFLGFNFGDGHFHNEELFAAIQEQAQFEPGELVVAWAESEPLWHGYQEYKLIDAALGVVETGRWQVKDALEAKPYLPDGPLPLTVTWRSPEFDRLQFTATDIFGSVAAQSAGDDEAAHEASPEPRRPVE